MQGLKGICPPRTVLSAITASSLGLTTALCGDEALVAFPEEGPEPQGKDLAQG